MVFLKDILKKYFFQRLCNRGKSFLYKKFGIGIYAIELKKSCLKICVNLADRCQRSLALSLLQHDIDKGVDFNEDIVDIQFLNMVLKEGDIFFDIGSNIGIYSLFAAKKVGVNGQIHCFEPFSENLATLYKNIKLNEFENVFHVNGHGLLDKPVMASFKKPLFGGSGLGMFVNKENLNNGIERVVELKVDTLDNYVSQNNIKKINFIKIDVEGAESRVLQGGTVTLKNLRPTYIQLEFGDPHPSSVGGASTAKDLYLFMKKFGYGAYYFGPDKKSLNYEEIDDVIQNAAGRHINLIFEYNQQNSI